MIAQFLGDGRYEPIYLYMAGAALTEYDDADGEDVSTFLRRFALDCGVVSLTDFFKLCGIHPQSFYTRIGRKKAKIITLPMLEKMVKAFKHSKRKPSANLLAEFVFWHVDIPEEMFANFGRTVAYHWRKTMMGRSGEIVQAFYESLDDDEL